MADMLTILTYALLLALLPTQGLNPLASPTSPTPTPTVMSLMPTLDATAKPTKQPTLQPTRNPTHLPTTSPSSLPTRNPSNGPSIPPSTIPTLLPSITPTTTPSLVPSHPPTVIPSHGPTRTPSHSPTHHPTVAPTHTPSRAPSLIPIYVPSMASSMIPLQSPTNFPTRVPTHIPTKHPTHATNSPTQIPIPSANQTTTPTQVPTRYRSDCFIGSKCRHVHECCRGGTGKDLHNIACSCKYSRQRTCYNRHCCIKMGQRCSCDADCCHVDSICSDGFCIKDTKHSVYYVYNDNKQTTNVTLYSWNYIYFNEFNGTLKWIIVLAFVFMCFVFGIATYYIRMVFINTNHSTKDDVGGEGKNTLWKINDNT
eukprot:791316_1